MFEPSTDRLIRKETALGTLREMEPPQEHIGLRVVAPMMEVETDDVIFNYARGLSSGLAPARAEDAESELAQKDLVLGGTGRASVVDWALKTRYSASDVMRYRENLMVAGALNGENSIGQVPRGIGSQIADFQTKVAKDDADRRGRLDNRIEWMCMTPLHTAGLAYQDSKIKFAVDYGRPSDQSNQAPFGGTWNLTTSDPIGAVLKMQEMMYDRHGVRMTRAIMSKKVLNSIINSDRFLARSGLVVGGTPSAPIDPRYILDGWGPNAAAEVWARATDMETPIIYDAVYRTRAVGSQTWVNNRFTDDRFIYFLPDNADVSALDDTIGFARTLTSPHPEGGFTPGFYEWEEETKDPWGVVRGTGIKAFPVFMHMEWTYSMQVLP